MFLHGILRLTNTTTFVKIIYFLISFFVLVPNTTVPTENLCSFNVVDAKIGYKVLKATSHVTRVGVSSADSSIFLASVRARAYLLQAQTFIEPIKKTFPLLVVALLFISIVRST